MWGVPPHAWLIVVLIVLVLATCTACATRRLDSCVASFVMIGPGLVTLDCRPPQPLEDQP